MRPAPARSLAAVALLTLLAGCSSKAHVEGAMPGANASALGPDEGDADRFGRLNGTVTNDELLPVAAARVDVLGPDKHATTDLDGYYEIAGLLPGKYTVEVILGQNDPVQREALVEAGATATVDFQVTLQRALVEEPYHVTTIVNGHMGCNVAGEACPGYPGTSDKQRFDHFFEARPVSFLYEVTWQRLGPGPPPGVYDDNQPGWIHRWDFDAKAGPEVTTHRIIVPPYARANMTVLGSVVPKSPATVTVESHGIGFLQNPGFAFEQDFTIYMTTFHLKDESATLCATPPEACPT